MSNARSFQGLGPGLSPAQVNGARSSSRCSGRLYLAFTRIVCVRARVRTLLRVRELSASLSV